MQRLGGDSIGSLNIKTNSSFCLSGRYLAHADGSNDSKPHITASLKTKNGDTIKNGHGNLSHLYYSKDRLPPVYRGAVQRKESSS